MAQALGCGKNGVGRWWNRVERGVAVKRTVSGIAALPIAYPPFPTLICLPGSTLQRVGAALRRPIGAAEACLGARKQISPWHAVQSQLAWIGLLANLYRLNAALHYVENGGGHFLFIVFDEPRKTFALDHSDQQEPLPHPPGAEGGEKRNSPRTKHREDPAGKPDHQGESHVARVFQDPLGGDEDAASHHAADEE